MNKTFNGLQVKAGGFLRGLAFKGSLEQNTKAASAQLNAFIEAHGGKYENGLTPDSVKAMPEYKTFKDAFEAAFYVEREFNGVFTRVFKQEYSEHMKAQREAKAKGAQ